MNNTRLEKTALLSYLTDVNTLKNAFAGAGIGALGLLGTQGIVSGIDALKRSLFPVPELPKHIYVNIDREVNKDEEEEGDAVEKKSSDSTNDFGKYFAVGFGLPVGLYSAYKLKNYLDKANMNIEFAKKLEYLDKLYDEKYSNKYSGGKKDDKKS